MQTIILKIIAMLTVMAWCIFIYVFCEWVTELVFGNPKDIKQIGKSLLLIFIVSIIITLLLLLCIV